MQKIKVLIVDDSALVRQILKEYLSRDPEIEIIGTANDPYIARDIMVKERPDVITLDIEMPRMDGLTFLKTFMRILPTPTIILSALTQKGKKISIEALEAGAIDVICKPQLGVADNLPLMMGDLVAAIKNAAKVNINKYVQKNWKTNETKQPITTNKSLDESTDRVIAIGASTGGVEALARILPLFSAASPGMVIVEHMPAGFTKSFAERLDHICQMRVKEAEDGDRIRDGIVLIAPGGEYHTIVKRSGGEYRIRLIKGDKNSGHCPSVNILFESVADEVGKNAVAALMTGMGSDGATGLLKIREAGGKTLIQNEETSVIFGMPGSAMKIGAANDAVPLMEIPQFIINCLK